MRRKLLELSGKSVTEIDSTLEKSPAEGSDFGNWLQEQREKHGLSRQQLADKSGIAAITLYFIETGLTGSPRESTINALRKALGELPKDVRTEVVESAEGGFGKFQGPFSIKEWQANADSVLEKRTPGIYIFYDVTKRPVYIGQSDDVQDRIYDHEQQFWFKWPMVDSIAYLIVKDEGIRKKLEAAMIKVVGDNAIFNSQHKI